MALNRSVLGFDSTFTDPSPRYAILPKTATSLFSTLEGDVNGNMVTQKDVFSLAGSPDLFHLQSTFKTASPTGGSFSNVDSPALVTKARTDASLGGVSSAYDFSKSYSGTDVFGLMGSVDAANSAGKAAATVLGGGVPAQAVSAPMKSGTVVLFAVGGLAVLGIGLYFFLR